MAASRLLAAGAAAGGRLANAIERSVGANSDMCLLNSSVEAVGCRVHPVDGFVKAIGVFGQSRRFFPENGSAGK